MVNCINLIIEMSPHFILGLENVPCVAEVVNRSLKADCTNYINQFRLLTSPPGDPRGFKHPFCPAPWGFTYKFVPGGPGFRRGQIFPEMNENLSNIIIFRECFEKAIQNGRKTLAFVYANCICLLEYLY